MSARRRLATLAVAVGGVLIGHWLTYLAVAPIAGSRATILHQTGHSYLGLANDLALVAALAALASMFIAQLTTPEPSGGVLGVTGRVVRFQVCAFIGMEVLERVTAGSPLSELIRTGILPIGIAAQVAIGILAAFVIRWLLLAADRVAAALGRRRRSASSGPHAPAAPAAGLRPRLSAPVRGRCPRSTSFRLIDHVAPPCASHQTTTRRMDHECPREIHGCRGAGDRRARTDPRHRVRACRTERRAVRSRDRVPGRAGIRRRPERRVPPTSRAAASRSPTSATL